MGILLDKFDKFIVEHGSAIVRGDHIALLREQLQIAEKQIARLEKENGDLKTENAALKDDVNKARAEVAKLTPQTKALSHEDLEETDMTVLKLIAIAQNQPWAQAIADESGIDLVRVE